MAPPALAERLGPATHRFAQPAVSQDHERDPCLEPGQLGESLAHHQRILLALDPPRGCAWPSTPGTAAEIAANGRRCTESPPLPDGCERSTRPSGGNWAVFQS